MIDNNLDFDIALYPYELVTYGETGQPCQNWLQYCLIKKYLEELNKHRATSRHKEANDNAVTNTAGTY